MLALLICIALAVAVVFAYTQGYLDDATSWFDTDDGDDGTGGTGGVIPAGDQVVTKPIRLVCVDELAGGALDGTTSALTVYDSDGKTVLETVTLSSGQGDTSQSFSSGRVLWVKYYYDTTIDAYMFWQVTIPKMSSADAESLTVNQVTLKTREAGAYTDSLLTSSGLTLTDGVYLNTTGSANDTGTMTYSFFTTTDNTGYPTFYDPIYKMDMKVVLWAEVSQGAYSAVSLTGFDGSFEQGSTMKYYKYISADDISKQKVGNDYVLDGAGSHSFGWNCAGFSNSTNTTYTIAQFTLKIYSNDAYMRQYGDYGPYDFSGAEQTVNFADLS